jgi:hypothetical protein
MTKGRDHFLKIITQIFISFAHQQNVIILPMFPLSFSHFVVGKNNNLILNRKRTKHVFYSKYEKKEKENRTTNKKHSADIAESTIN